MIADDHSGDWYNNNNSSTVQVFSFSVQFSSTETPAPASISTSVSVEKNRKNSNRITTEATGPEERSTLTPESSEMFRGKSSEEKKREDNPTQMHHNI